MKSALFCQGKVDMTLRVPYDGELWCKRQDTGLVLYEQLPENTFPLRSSPPITTLATLLSMVNVAIIFLCRLRQFRQAGALAELTSDAQEKEALAECFVSLACIDDLTAWRKVPRPSSLWPLPPSPLGFPTLPIPRHFFTANADVRNEVQLEEERVHHSSSNLSEGEQMVLMLGLEEGATSQASHGPAAAHSDEAACSVSGSEERSRGPTCQQVSGDECSDDEEEVPYTEQTRGSVPNPSCEGCLRDHARCLEIETKLVPQLRGEVQESLSKRAEEVGMGRALEEVLFRMEGLKRYGRFQDRLEALDEELQRRQSVWIGEADAEMHSRCLSGY
jgi:hypothetical protein